MLDIFKQLLKLLLRSFAKSVVALAIVGVGVIYGPDAHEGFIQKHTAASVVYITTKTPEGGSAFLGTGFHVKTAKGKTVVITNNHVCLAASPLFVSGNGKTQVPVSIIANYSKTDLCMLDGIEGAPALSMADGLKRTETIYTVGHPESHPYAFHKGNAIFSRTFTFDSGIIDNIGKALHAPTFIGEEDCAFEYTKPEPHVEMEMTPDGPRPLFFKTCSVTIKSITTTIPVWFGSSGSPVVNKFGKLVGVIYAKSPAGISSEMISSKQLFEFLKGF